MRLTRLERTDGQAVIVSPTRTVPERIWPRVAAEVLVGPDDELHREAQRAAAPRCVDLDGLEVLEQARAVEPRRALAARDDVVAVQRAHRDGVERGAGEQRARTSDAMPSKTSRSKSTRSILLTASTKFCDAEQPRDPRVAPRLVENAVPRVHEQNRDVGRGRAGRHVARVLLVPRRVGQDELAAARREIAVRDVDRDALLAFGAQAVGEEREVDRARPSGSSTPSRPTAADLRRPTASRTAAARSACSSRRRRCRPCRCGAVPDVKK